ncbi:hypothetical protein [Paraburkholderia dinghuensis]|uniref:Uncharacterized protein n=1 Tax=Paraburkholderia dinghuensis TaxID=2305225 RepID=A0A3N6MRM9_9BURK|nr:hypothetical protein [Paraburkholderia dinghuensis]RQH04465.1 hypothetical protein D1Y85_18570 [Paraburkholderia dinghuensis]
MNGKTLALSALASTLLLSGCISDTRVAASPARPNAVVAAPPPPPRQAVVVAEPVYVPEPHDAYISVALDSDIVFAGGNTYIWYLGHDGRRYRHFYGHGDLRGEVMHRRANLRLVMTHHDGHLPMQKVQMAPPPTRHAPPAGQPHPPEKHQPPQARPQQQAHQPHQPPSGKPAPTANRTADENHPVQPHS